MSVSLGSWSMLGTPASAALLADVGADWLVLDQQHGLYDDRAVVDTLARLRAASPELPVLVRVAANEPWLVGRALDAGAAGVIIPMVGDGAEAARAAAATHYPPLGTRSWGPLTGLYGGTAIDPATANAGVQVLVMVETRDALDRVDEIAATPGVDTVFVGPFDLAIALGTDVAALLADTSDGNPLDAIVAACRRAGVTAGAFAGSPSTAAALAARGFTRLAVAVDSMLVAPAARALLDETRRSVDG